MIDYPSKLFEQAACIGIDVNMFYAEHSAEYLTHEMRTAKKICGTCPIQAECLEWALLNERWGLWGGTAPYERDAIRKKRNIIVSTPEGRSKAHHDRRIA